MPWRRPNYHLPAPVNAKGLIISYKVPFLLYCIPVAPNNTLNQCGCQLCQVKQMYHWKVEFLYRLKKMNKKATLDHLTPD